MTEHAVLILSAGEAKRWAGWAKQLAPLWDGETVLSRMVRQVRSHGLEPTIVARDPEIFEVATAPIFHPGPTSSVFETAALCRHLWAEETTLLLGDVVFTDAVIADTLASPGNSLRIFTNPRETYALSFGIAIQDQVENALWHHARLAEAGGKRPLRELRDTVAPSSWVIVKDRTDDIDSPEKYELIMARWGKPEAIR